MAIDWQLLPMKVHYFLRFMGTGPLTVFLPVIVQQMGVPEHIVGYIWTVLPFVSLVTKTSAGAIADTTRGHRAVFLLGLVFMVVPLTALYWVPDIPYSTSNNALSLSSNATISPPSFVNLTSESSLSTPPVEDSEVSSDVQPTTLPTPHEGDVKLVGSYEFWLLFVCLLAQYCGHVTVITMQETVCFQLLGEKRHKYGQQRVWGTIGIGLSAIISGALVDLYSKGSGQKDYLPAHIITAVFLLADIMVVATLKFPRPERKMSSSALQGALWRPHVLLVLVTTAVIGVVAGLLWTFEFILAAKVAGKSFKHLKLLLGLLMGVQSFLAEVPFFVLAGRIIQRLGHANTLFVSLLGFTLRLILYSFASNPWFFLPIDLLHGISFAVAYPCFTSYASSVAPKGAAATTQAIFGATFFGATGVGGLVGGWLFKAVGGQRTFLLMGLGTGVYSFLFFVVHGVLRRVRTLQELGGEEDEEARKEDTNCGKGEQKDDVEDDAKVDLIGKERNERGGGKGKDMVMGVSYKRTDI